MWDYTTGYTEGEHDAAKDSEEQEQAWERRLTRLARGLDVLGGRAKTPEEFLRHMAAALRAVRTAYRREHRCWPNESKEYAEWTKAVYFLGLNAKYGLLVDVAVVPTVVWRRLLVHANIDYQDAASFLRRVTPEQVAQIREHANIVRIAVAAGKQHLRQTDFPCFRDGWQNTIANVGAWCMRDPQWVALAHNEGASHWHPRKAIAFNFANLGFGVPLYHDNVDDVPAPRELTQQFVSLDAIFSVLMKSVDWIVGKADHLPTEEDVEAAPHSFVIDVEPGTRGGYAWLFDTLWQRILGTEVTLGTHVCPKWWATIILWTLIAIVGPLAGITALGAWAVGATEVAMTAASVFGVTDGFVACWMLLRLGLRRIHRAYDVQFVKSLLVVIGTLMALVFLGPLVARIALAVQWTHPVVAVLTALGLMWISYMIARRRMCWPWQLPVVGPILLSALGVTSAWIYRAEAWSMLSETGIIGLIGMVIVVVVTALSSIVAAAHVYTWLDRWVVNDDVRTTHRRIRVVQAMVFASIIVATAALYWFTAFYHPYAATADMVVIMALVVPVFLVCFPGFTMIGISSATWSTRKNDLAYARAVVQELEVPSCWRWEGSKGCPLVARAVLMNPALYDPSRRVPTGLRAFLDLQIVRDFLYSFDTKEAPAALAAVMRQVTTADIKALRTAEISYNEAMALTYIVHLHDVQAGLAAYRAARSMEDGRAAYVETLTTGLKSCVHRIAGPIARFLGPFMVLGLILRVTCPSWENQTDQVVDNDA